MAEVIRFVEKLNAAQQLTATLTPSMVSMLSNNVGVWFVDKQVILAATAMMCSVIGAMSLATLHRIAPTRFLPQEHHTIKTDLIQGINISTPKGTDHTLPIMVPDMGEISAGHSPMTILTLTGTGVSEDTHHAPHPAITAGHVTLG